MASLDGTRAAKTEIKRMIQAQFPIIHVNSYEESRVLEAVLDVVEDLERHVLIWSTSKGVFNPNLEEGHRGQALPQADLAVAIESFEKAMTNDRAAEHGMVFVLLDPYPYLSDRNSNPIYRRRLRDLAFEIRDRGWKASCIIVAPSLNIPYELEHDVTVLDFPLPTRREIHTYVTEFLARLSKSAAVTISGDPIDLAERFTEAAVGLSQREIENALSYATIQDLTIDEADVGQIFQQKRQTVRKSGMLEFIDTEALSLDQVGGLDRMKVWLNRRRAALNHAGVEFGLAVPKGVLLTGVPGCGKSLSAKCVAASWQLPLLRLDMGRVFSSLVGASEEHMRHAIHVAEAVAPCVLWIDEIEKGLVRQGQHIGDSGVSMRVLGTFLTWLQEKTSAVFVVATANEILQLPPEMLRKGRFDGVFFVDLPNAEERRAILEIHLARVGRGGPQLDLDTLVDLSADHTGSGGMTGAEIAAWVDDAMLLAFERTEAGGDPDTLTLADFEQALEEISLLARVREADLLALRQWGAQHAQPAS